MMMGSWSGFGMQIKKTVILQFIQKISLSKSLRKSAEETYL
jgi:hypothetical protein